MICRVARPGTAACATEVAVFVSRRDTLPDIAPYRKLLCLPAKRILVTRSDKGGIQEFRHLLPNSSTEVTLDGPCRLELESRMILPSQDTLVQDYRVNCLLDGCLFATLEANTAPENTKVLYFLWDSQVLGRLNRGYLEIPPGRHRLALVPTANVVARLLKQETPDYLIAKANQPPLTAEEVRSTALANTSGRSSWTLSDGEMVRAVVNPSGDAAEEEQVANRLRTDNSRRQGSLQATALMESAGRKRPDAPEVRTKANEIKGLSTGYRNLLPSNKGVSEAQTFHWFIDRKLKRPDQPDLVVAERHVNTYLRTAPQRVFRACPRSGHRALAAATLQDSAEQSLALPHPQTFFRKPIAGGRRPACHASGLRGGDGAGSHTHVQEQSRMGCGYAKGPALAGGSRPGTPASRSSLSGLLYAWRTV